MIISLECIALCQYTARWFVFKYPVYVSKLTLEMIQTNTDSVLLYVEKYTICR